MRRTIKVVQLLTGVKTGKHSLDRSYLIHNTIWPTTNMNQLIIRNKYYSVDKINLMNTKTIITSRFFQSFSPVT
jgi:hypothetical protein